MRSQASAPGKAILFGEHAVVYGCPALAIPISSIRAQATGKASAKPLTIVAEDLPGSPLTILPGDSGIGQPLALMARLTAKQLEAENLLGEVRIQSNIPIASGLGSGAAVSAALGRAIAQLHGADLPAENLNRLVFEVEKLHHGTPSGIDNTVVVYERPLYFVKDAAFEFLDIAKPLWLALADTGVASLTRDAVAAARALAESAPRQTAQIFGEIAAIVDEAKACIERGSADRLGALMTANHRLLKALTVSSPELDCLVDAALKAGAMGAKLSGGGRGGNIIALADEATMPRVKNSLIDAGAKRVIVTVAE